MTLITRVHNLDGTLRLDLAPAGGYRRETLDGVGGVKWRRRRQTSPVVDGVFESGRVKDPQDRTDVLKVTGPTWDVIEARTLALEAAVGEDDFLWVIGRDGVLRTYRSVGPADVDSSFTREDVFARRRFVTLTFTVQPDPTVTGV